MEKAQEIDLSKQLALLTKELKSYTSLKAVFLRGIIYGVATVLGATVIAALVFGSLYRFTKPILDELPLSSAVLEALEAQSFK